MLFLGILIYTYAIQITMNPWVSLHAKFLVNKLSKNKSQNNNITEIPLVPVYRWSGQQIYGLAHMVWEQIGVI